MKSTVRVRRIQAVTLGLLVLAGIINFLDRSSLGVANLAIRGELELSGTQMGALLSAFSLAYGIGQLPLGFVLDRVGPRLVLAVGLGLWSLAQVLTGFVGGIGSFLGLRVLLGLGEAPFFGCGVMAIREWFSPTERGRAIATMNVSSMTGLMLAPPLLTALMLHFGWRRMFMIVGAIGLVLAAVWYPVNRNRKDVELAADEVEFLGSDVGSAQTSSGHAVREWLGLFRQRTMWGMMLGFGGINYTNWLYISWLPGYLQTGRHVSVEQTGWWAILPFLAGAVGMITSGTVSDALIRCGHETVNVLRGIVVVGMVCSAIGSVLAPQARSTGEAVAAISVAMCAIHFAGTAAWGFVPALSEGGLIGRVVTIQTFGSYMISSIAPLATGWLLDVTKSFSLALQLCALMTLLGAAAYWWMVRVKLRNLAVRA